jgi:hypothetical protein
MKGAIRLLNRMLPVKTYMVNYVYTGSGNTLGLGSMIYKKQYMDPPMDSDERIRLSDLIKNDPTWDGPVIRDLAIIGYQRLRG